MKKITLYTKDYCPYCKSAVALLEEKGVEFTELDVTNDQAELDKAIAISNCKTVPQLFVNGKFIGGFDDMKDLDDKKELNDILGVPCQGYC